MMQSRQEQGDGSTTILARPFPKDVDEQRVHALFAVYGRITKVRLRFQQSNLQQKDSAALKREQAQIETLKEAAKKAQHEASNAQASQKLAQSQLISKNIEMTSLKGQLEAAVKRAKANAESVHAQYRPKVQNLEGQVQQLKDALETELSRNRKRTLPKFEL
ncbi:hypothetical protein WJX79_003098 [Trebouxia sp. C0005]